MSVQISMSCIENEESKSTIAAIVSFKQAGNFYKQNFEGSVGSIASSAGSIEERNEDL